MLVWQQIHENPFLQIASNEIEQIKDEGSDAPSGYIRFCFCKQDAVIDEALARLAAFLTAARAESAQPDIMKPWK